MWQLWQMVVVELRPSILWGNQEWKRLTEFGSWLSTCDPRAIAATSYSYLEFTDNLLGLLAVPIGSSEKYSASEGRQQRSWLTEHAAR